MLEIPVLPILIAITTIFFALLYYENRVYDLERERCYIYFVVGGVCALASLFYIIGWVGSHPEIVRFV